MDAILAQVRQATVRYLDIERARADGFVQLSGMEPRHGYHFARIDAGAWFSAALAGGQVDLARPPMLLYVERQGVWQLAGVEYALLQHKLLALIPIVFGTVGILRLRGLLRRPGWTYVFPVLAVLGGASLFAHFHDGRFHLDAIYLQHAAMGSAALGLGVALLIAGRRREKGRLVLLLYSEL